MAIAVGAAVVAGVLLVLARSSNRPVHRPRPSQPPGSTEAPGEWTTHRFGEPVKLANMTFVVNSLTAVPSISIPNQQPLLPEPGQRLWLLTVRVRNDGATTEREPFCHRRHRPGRTDYITMHGADLVTQSSTHTSWLTQRRQSVLIDDDLCRVIRPGETRTFQMFYRAQRGSGIASHVTVALANRTEAGEWVHASVVR